MKYLGHVPTESYGFISVEVEGTPDEAVMAYKELKRAYEGGEGHTMKEFAKMVYEYCTTEGIKNGGDSDYSSNEKLLLGELTKLIRKNK